MTCTTSALPVETVGVHGRSMEGAGATPTRSATDSTDQGGSDRASARSSKAALSAYSKGLAVEVGRYGVRVDCVLPGFIPNEDHAERLNDRAEAAGMPTEQFLQQIVNAIPLGRPGTPQEAAQLIAYLVSPAASYLSGAQILFDGAAFPTL